MARMAKEYICSNCGHTFSNRPTLDTHVETRPAICKPSRNNDRTTVRTCKWGCRRKNGQEMEFKRRDNLLKHYRTAFCRKRAAEAQKGRGEAEERAEERGKEDVDEKGNKRSEGKAEESKEKQEKISVPQWSASLGQNVAHAAPPSSSGSAMASGGVFREQANSGGGDKKQAAVRRMGQWCVPAGNVVMFVKRNGRGLK